MKQINDLNLPKRHSRLGIASTVIGGGLPILVTLLLVLALVFVSDSVKNSVGNDLSESLGNVFGIAFIVVGLIAPPLHLIGLIFGLVGAFSKKVKKLFPIIGIILNLFFGLIGVGIFAFLFTNPSLTAFR